MTRSLREGLHRHVWRRLPRAVRRSLLFSGAHLIAPRITTSAMLSAPVIVVGALRTASGLGESARLCHDAIKALGVPVFGIDIAAQLMQPVDDVAFDFTDGRHLVGPGTLIVHVNGPLMALAMSALTRAFVRNKYVAGYWAWELPQAPRDWKLGLHYVHEVWVPSQFTANALASMSGRIPVRVVPHPVAIGCSDTRRRPVRSSDAPFVVLNIFDMASSFERKNPLAAIAAFRCAFDQDAGATLIIKCANIDCYDVGARQLREACDGVPNITLVDQHMSPGQLAAMYANADVLISLHRAEGFGLVIAEAMLRGLPTICTQWSGNVDFTSEATSIPVGYQLVSALDPQLTYNFSEMSWADPDIAQAAVALRTLREQPEWANVLGDQARHFAMATFSANTYANVLRHLLEIPPQLPR